MQDAGQRPPAASTAAVRSGGCSLPCSCGLARSAPPGPAGGLRGRLSQPQEAGQREGLAALEHPAGFCGGELGPVWG